MILVSIVLFIMYYPVSYTLGSGSAVTVAHALVRVSRYTMLWFCPNATSRAWKPATTVDGIAFPTTLRCDTRKRNRNRWMNRWQNARGGCKASTRRGHGTPLRDTSPCIVMPTALYESRVRRGVQSGAHNARARCATHRYAHRCQRPRHPSTAPRRR